MYIVCFKLHHRYVSGDTCTAKFDYTPFWQALKTLGYKNKSNESSKVVLKIDNETCDDSKTVADHFNTFFTNIA